MNCCSRNDYSTEDLVSVIKPNEPEFTQALVEIIQEKAKVTILRISHIVIAFDNDVVHALFTLYEKPEKYGPVEIPKNDVKLDGKRLILDL
jgi:hypothetical protein